MFLSGCQSGNQDYTATDPMPEIIFSYIEPAPRTEQLAESGYYQDEPDDVYLGDTETAAFIRSIISAAPLELNQSELRQHTLRYVHHGNYLGVIPEYWADPTQIDPERLLGWYAFFEFNLRYVPQYLEANPNMSFNELYQLGELVVDEEIVESAITRYVETDIERLRLSPRYDAEARGYRFMVMDGLGGMSPLYAANVWMYESFIVIEVRNERDAVDGVPEEYRHTAFALIETISEDRFIYRAYIRASDLSKPLAKTGSFTVHIFGQVIYGNKIYDAPAKVKKLLQSCEKSVKLFIGSSAEEYF